MMPKQQSSYCGWLQRIRPFNTVWFTKKMHKFTKHKQTCTHAKHLENMLHWVEAEFLNLIEHMTFSCVLLHTTWEFFFLVFYSAANSAEFPADRWIWIKRHYSETALREKRHFLGSSRECECLSQLVGKAAEKHVKLILHCKSVFCFCVTQEFPKAQTDVFK